MSKIYQVDAFTNSPFEGNPAAVCVLDKMPSESWMKKIAKEMNLSETAFVIKKEKEYELRWFTPLVEIDLCGHATLATAHILWTEGYLDNAKDATFHTRSGVLTAKNIEGYIQLDFPIIEYKEAEVPKELIKSLKVKPVFQAISKDNYIIEVSTLEEVISIKPDFNMLSKVNMHGVIVTSKATDYDFVSRFFAPSVGVLEDPVTGSIHCVLVRYWQDKLKKEKFKAYQASKRGGELLLEIKNDRVLIKGNALTIFKGELLV